MKCLTNSLGWHSHQFYDIICKGFQDELEKRRQTGDKKEMEMDDEMVLQEFSDDILGLIWKLWELLLWDLESCNPLEYFENISKIKRWKIKNKLRSYFPQNHITINSTRNNSISPSQDESVVLKINDVRFGNNCMISKEVIWRRQKTLVSTAVRHLGGTKISFSMN